VAQPKVDLAYDKETDLRIQRMAVQKVAVEAMGPFPITSKGEPAAAAEKWKEVFSGLCDFLVADVEAAGQKVAIAPEPATVSDNGNQEVLTLDQAVLLTDRVKEVSEGNDVLRNAIKLFFVKCGVKPGPIDTVICQLTKPQADELVELINKEV
jgi:hypothetical protein